MSLLEVSYTTIWPVALDFKNPFSIVTMYIGFSLLFMLCCDVENLHGLFSTIRKRQNLSKPFLNPYIST